MRIRNAHDNPPLIFVGMSTESILKAFVGLEVEIDGSALRYETQEIQCNCCGSWVEEETEPEISAEDVRDMVADAFGDDEEIAWVAHDGSVAGLEVKTHPMTYETLIGEDMKERFEQLFDSMSDYNLNDPWDDGCNSGLHVHLSNSAFVDTHHLKRFVQAFEKNFRQIMRFAKRDDEGYCKSTGVDPDLKPKKFKKEYLGRRRNRVKMQVVNTSHSNTVEVRAFKGVQSYNAMLGYVELCVMFVLLTQEQDADPRKLTWATMKDHAKKFGFEYLLAELCKR
jgi:hypothetical protein